MDGQHKPRALVTGASAGLGAAFARRLARDGYSLILVARDQARLDALAAELGGAEVWPADLADPAGCHAIEDKIKAGPALDLLVNNAGIGTVGAFAGLDLAREMQEIQLNVLALVRLTHAALPGMIQAGRGGVINVSSVAGFAPGPRNATYCATKAYVTSFSESLAEELRGSGVKVQALCPGFTHTEFHQRAQINKAKIPASLWMNAEEVIDISLRGLARGQVVCVPGAQNRATVALLQVIPRGIARRISAKMTQDL